MPNIYDNINTKLSEGLQFTCTTCSQQPFGEIVVSVGCGIIQWRLTVFVLLIGGCANVLAMFGVSRHSFPFRCHLLFNRLESVVTSSCGVDPGDINEGFRNRMRLIPVELYQSL